MLRHPHGTYRSSMKVRDTDIAQSGPVKSAACPQVSRPGIRTGSLQREVSAAGGPPRNPRLSCGPGFTMADAIRATGRQVGLYWSGYRSPFVWSSFCQNSL